MASGARDLDEFFSQKQVNKVIELVVQVFYVLLYLGDLRVRAGPLVNSLVSLALLLELLAGKVHQLLALVDLLLGRRVVISGSITVQKAKILPARQIVS